MHHALPREIGYADQFRHAEVKRGIDGTRVSSSIGEIGNHQFAKTIQAVLPEAVEYRQPQIATRLAQFHTLRNFRAHWTSVIRQRLGKPQDLRAPLFLGALGLLVLDALVVFSLAGGIRRLLPRRRMAAVLVIAAALAARVSFSIAFHSAM